MTQQTVRQAIEAIIKQWPGNYMPVGFLKYFYAELAKRGLADLVAGGWEPQHCRDIDIIEPSAPAAPDGEHGFRVGCADVVGDPPAPSDTLSRGEVERMMELAEAATPGPWYPVLIADVYVLQVGPNYEDDKIEGPTSEDIGGELSGTSTEQGEKNMKFAAASRTFIPSICRAYLRLLDRDAKCKRLVELTTFNRNSAAKEIAALRKELLP